MNLSFSYICMNLLYPIAPDSSQLSSPPRKNRVRMPNHFDNIFVPVSFGSEWFWEGTQQLHLEQLASPDEKVECKAIRLCLEISITQLVLTWHLDWSSDCSLLGLITAWVRQCNHSSDTRTSDSSALKHREHSRSLLVDPKDRVRPCWRLRRPLPTNERVT